jgi:hypothetical protein
VLLPIPIPIYCLHVHVLNSIPSLHSVSMPIPFLFPHACVYLLINYLHLNHRVLAPCSIYHYYFHSAPPCPCASPLSSINIISRIYIFHMCVSISMLTCYSRYYRTSIRLDRVLFYSSFTNNYPQLVKRYIICVTLPDSS